ncbi:Clp protease N-terminal domain-containing protein [Streptomyces sp. WELS2]|uniref:Clp protease N-terminal domain-containing protein n=1 Tax=Streptomyces sp. WELS2 TaxID=2749435 RepID=UPI002867CDE7|nr:Clp protease N-terminal domain-containing protein [Streptomyces sp. WELS2]
MQPRTADRTAPDQAVPHQDGAAGLDAELAAVVAGARRRAVRDGDRQTDTAHLLHALLEHDPEARAAVGEPRRLARLLGYLVQRSIGYGLRWRAGVEDSGALPVVAAPAGPGQPAAGTTGRYTDTTGRDAGRWSPAAAAVLVDARARARRRNAHRVAGTDLLAALAADPGSRAVEVLERAGIAAHDLIARIEAGTGTRADDCRAEGERPGPSTG